MKIYTVFDINCTLTFEFCLYFFFVLKTNRTENKTKNVLYRTVHRFLSIFKWIFVDYFVLALSLFPSIHTSYLLLITVQSASYWDRIRYKSYPPVHKYILIPPNRGLYHHLCIRIFSAHFGFDSGGFSNWFWLNGALSQ